jgi:hypothetical protein
MEGRMTYDQAVYRALRRTAEGVPHLPGRNKHKPGGWCIYRVPLSSQYPRSPAYIRGAEWTKCHPVESRAFGERNGTHTRPERVLRGEQVGNSKLKEANVVEIRDTYKRGLFSMYELAKIFDVSRPLIGYIVHREIWTHVA